MELWKSIEEMGTPLWTEPSGANDITNDSLLRAGLRDIVVLATCRSFDASPTWLDCCGLAPDLDSQYAICRASAFSLCFRFRTDWTQKLLQRLLTCPKGWAKRINRINWIHCHFVGIRRCVMHHHWRVGLLLTRLARSWHLSGRDVAMTRPTRTVCPNAGSLTFACFSLQKVSFA